MAEKSRIVVANMLKRGVSDEDIYGLAECTPEFVEEVRKDGRKYCRRLCLGRMKQKNKIHRKISHIIIIFLMITLAFYIKKSVYAAGNAGQTADADDGLGSSGENTAEDNGTVNNDENEDEAAIVVVIDPGHGGKNEGAVCGEYVEKELTLKTALAMKKELEKYEGIEVYLTREDDADLELTDRTAYAKDLEADFFVCLHYNMSALHKLYGAECWISSYGECYAKGRDLALIEMEMLTELGLYDRGIKTRHNSRGTDYYGITRSCTAYGIPSVLIEHCHLDQENDKPFINQDTWPEMYGVLDATAVARYFGLKSDELGVDYSGEIHEVTPVMDVRMGPDTTEPEYCEVRDLKVDEEAGIVTGKISAYDPESRILYYTASFNYGNTYHEYYRFEPDENGEVSFEITLPKNTKIRLIIGVLNMYGGLAESELLYSGKIIDTSVDAKEADHDGEGVIDDQTDAPLDLGSSSDGRSPDEAYPGRNQNVRSVLILAICLLVLCLPLILYYILWRHNERKRIRRIKQRRMEYHYERDEKKELENELEARERERTERLLGRK